MSKSRHQIQSYSAKTNEKISGIWSLQGSSREPLLINTLEHQSKKTSTSNILQMQPTNKFLNAYKQKNYIDTFVNEEGTTLEKGFDLTNDVKQQL